MSKYRIRVTTAQKTAVFSGPCPEQKVYIIERKIAGLFWSPVDFAFSEHAARNMIHQKEEYVEKVRIAKNFKDEILEVE
ncbi:hypothetical protein D3C84_330270 [compost metagenome]